MKVEELIGIIRASKRGLDEYDDVPFIDLDFSDGSSVTICSGYGGYSEDEYPAFIWVVKNENNRS